MDQKLIQYTMDVICDKRNNSAVGMIPLTQKLPIKILLIGYCGAGNVGADIRTAEIIRQIFQIFKPEQLSLAYTSKSPINMAPFDRCHWQKGNTDLNDFMMDYDGLIACEGSLFKSQFSNIMAISFIGALGVAAAENKLSIAYGSDAGEMDPHIANLSKFCCQNSLIIARSKGSKKLLNKQLALNAVLGADTAWTFESSPQIRGQEILRNFGWDGQSKIICISPINPFWWPVRPDMEKVKAMHSSGAYKEIHRHSIFFHNDSEEIREQYHHYIDAIADSINDFCLEFGVFPVLVGMESLDLNACQDLKSKLTLPGPIILSGEWSIQDIVSVIRCSHIVISSRYHAIVTSMSGMIPTIGISIDERIENLYAECGIQGCLIKASNKALSSELLTTLHNVHKNHDKYSSKLPTIVAQQLIRMSKMGQILYKEITSRYSDIDPIIDNDVESFLPELSPSLRLLLQEQKT